MTRFLARGLGSFLLLALALVLSGCPDDRRDNFENPVNNPPTLGDADLTGSTASGTREFTYGDLDDPDGDEMELTVVWDDTGGLLTGGPFDATLLDAGTSPGTVVGNRVTDIPDDDPTSGTFVWDALEDVRNEVQAQGAPLGQSYDIEVTVTPSSGSAVGTDFVIPTVVSVFVPTGPTPPQITDVFEPAAADLPVTSTADLEWEGLVDLDGDDAILEFEWTPDGGTTLFPATIISSSLSGSEGSLGPGSNEITVLDSAVPDGTVEWDALADVSATLDPGTHTVEIQATPRDSVSGEGGTEVSDPFDVIVPDPLDVRDVSPSGRRGDITFSFVLDDSDGPNVIAEVFFRIQDPNDPNNFTEEPATLKDPTDELVIEDPNRIVGLTSQSEPDGLPPNDGSGSTSPQTYVAVWDSLADVGSTNPPPVQLVVRGVQDGNLEDEALSEEFILLNKPVIDRVVPDSGFDAFFAPEIGPEELFRVEGRNFSTNEPSLAALVNKVQARVVESNSDTIVADALGTNTGFLEVVTGATFDGEGNLESGSLSNQFVVKIRGDDTFADGGLEDSFPTSLPQRSDATNHAAFGDLDGDGDLDLVVGTQDRNQAYLNQDVNENLTARLPQEYDTASLPATERIATGTATAATADTLEDTAASFPTPLVAGSEVEITTGTGAGQVRTVVSNTSTELTVDADWVTVPDTTSTYDVRSPVPELQLYVVRSLVAHDEGPYRIPDDDGGNGAGSNDDLTIRVTRGHTTPASTETYEIDLNDGTTGRRLLSAREVADRLNEPGAGLVTGTLPLRYSARVLNSNRVEIVPLSPADRVEILPASPAQGTAPSVLGYDDAFGNRDSDPGFTAGDPGVTLRTSDLDANVFDGAATTLAGLVNGDVNPDIADGSSGTLVLETPEILVLSPTTVDDLFDLNSDTIESRIESPFDTAAVPGNLELEVGGLELGFTIDNPGGGDLTAIEVVNQLNDQNSGLITGTATGGSASTLDDTGASFPTPLTTGAEVELTGGTGAGQTRTIVSNTATQLTVAPDWATAPDGSSDYEVRFPRLPFFAELGRGGTRVRLFSTGGEGIHIVHETTDPGLIDAFAFLGKFVKPHARGIGEFTDETGTVFPTATVPTQQDFTTQVALVDVEGDGDLDVYFANAREQNRLLINDGTGVFSEETSVRLPALNDATHGVAVSDVDGDGDPDLVLANDGPNRILLNDGTGTFDTAGNSLFTGPDETFGTADDPENFDSFTTDVAVDDLDGDGIPDIAFSNLIRDDLAPNEGPQVLHGTGIGGDLEPHYLDRTLDVLPTTGPDDTDEVPPRSFTVNWGFVDVDELPDLILGGPSQDIPDDGQPNSTNRIFINDPDGDGDPFNVVWQHQSQGSYFPYSDAPGDDDDRDDFTNHPRLATDALVADAGVTFERPAADTTELQQLIFQKLDFDDFDILTGGNGRLFSDHSRMIRAMGDGRPEELLTGTATGGSTSTLLDDDVTPGPFVISLVGAEVENLSTGEVRRIDAVLASDEIEVFPSWTAPTSGDQYVIRGPGIRSNYVLVANDLDDFTVSPEDPTQTQIDGQNEIYVRGALEGQTMNGEVDFSVDRAENPFGHWSPWSDVDNLWDFRDETDVEEPVLDSEEEDDFDPFVPERNDATLGGVLADVDDDGDIDAWFGNQGQDRLIMNNGSSD